MEKISLTKERETLLITLYARAGESRLPDSLLNDTFAAEVVSRLDYDFSKLEVRRDAMIGVAMRAFSFDEITRGFIYRYPNAIVLHLGCGLDSRVFRVDPPKTVRWFDVDYPDVIAIRRRVYPEREGCTMIGSSVVHTEWLDEVPTDAPTLVIAEGLFMYLRKEDVYTLLGAITRRMPGGEIVFDAFSRLGVRIMSRNRMVKATGAEFHWGINNAHKLEREIPKLKLLGEQINYDPSQIARFSLPSRLTIRTLFAIPMLRKLGRIIRYRF